ncbi:helix-turn-helix transcriptional regulator [Actinosynnema sp. NPDC020468]|uniref:helix-turn-helix domain-containing protein n=1 Tax=Actinosynnema sp. NPDC020468 TaxID=3154488 RepID=UPI0033FE61FB
MPGPLPHVIPLLDELRELRLRCGNPSEQALAHKIGYSRQSVSAVLNGHRLPRWQFVEKYARECGADEQKITRLHDLWLDISLGTREPDIGEQEGDLFGGRHSLDVTWYRDNEEFYGAGARRIAETRSEIRVTYIRQHPPTQYTSEAAARYFATMLEWASKPGARSVRRIIGVRSTDGQPERLMADWLRQHFAATRDVLNYEARVMAWSPRADGLNMALLDDSTTFLAFSGRARQGLSGLSVESPVFLRYFSEHFEQLWAPLTPLDDYLADL